MLEITDRHCKHKDCVYRGWLSAPNGVATCDYILIEGRSRNCKISECDKYRTGIKTTKSELSFLYSVVEDD